MQYGTLCLIIIEIVCASSAYKNQELLPLRVTSMKFKVDNSNYKTLEVKDIELTTAIEGL